MYLFVVHFINMDNDEERSKAIEIDGQFFDREKDIYLHAMALAYDMKAENESFSSLEFISC